MFKNRFRFIFMMIATILFSCFATVAVADQSGGSSILSSDTQVAFLATPDVQEGIQYSCSKCHISFGPKLTRTLYAIKYDAANNRKENTIVAKGVVDFLPDIEPISLGLRLNKEWPIGMGSDLTLGVVNTAYSKQG